MDEQHAVRGGRRARARTVAALIMATAVLTGTVVAGSPARATATITRLTSGNTDAFALAVSGNGRYVVYVNNVTFSGGPFPSPEFNDLHLFDRTTSTSTVVRTGVGYGPTVSISDDGRYLAYDGAPGTQHISVFDRTNASTTIISSGALTREPTFSGDGSTLAFWTTEANNSSGLSLWRRSTGVITPVTASIFGGFYPDLRQGFSSDGSVLVFASEVPWTAGDVTGTMDVHQYTGGTLSRLTSSVWYGPRSGDPLISGSGRYVSWEEHAPWNGPPEPEPATKVIVRDRQLGTETTQTSGVGMRTRHMSTDGTKIVLETVGTAGVAIKTIGGATAAGPNLSSTTDPTQPWANNDLTVWAFSAADSPSVPGDTNAKRDVFSLVDVPATAPGAPTGVTATAGNSQATLTWTAPVSNGGSAITGYVITPYIGASAQTVVNTTGTGTSKVASGLANGTAYTFKVAAKNAVGTGAPSTASPAVTPAAPVIPYAPFTSWSALVDRQFVDLTTKAPSAASRSTWVSQLSAGTKTKGDLDDSLRRGAENLANVDPVVRVYRAFLGRAPDAGGLQFWIRRKRNVAPAKTWTVTQIATEFTNSNEFKTKYGSLTNRQFVTQIYTDVLGRAADQAGVDYWTRQIDLGRKTKAQVVVGFSESNEYKNKQAQNTDVAVAYIYLLGRAPTSSEASTWVTRQKAGTGHAVLLLELLESAAYAQRITG